jgi:catechol 2,3-dioxygenase-like lactoylglutathione lyase family enzyme
MSGDFRFVYFTPLYNETVAFLRDALELRVADSWDRAGDHRGTLFVARSSQANRTSVAAASGQIEVLENTGLDRRPSHTASGGPFAAIEVDDVDALHARIAARGVTVHYPLEDKPWGHRGFSVLDPNGVEIAFYSS